MGNIDLDSHILENDETWTHLDPDERHFTPRTVMFPDSTLPGLSQLWLLGNTWARRMPKDGDMRGIGNVWAEGLLDGTNLAGRIETLDACSESTSRSSIRRSGLVSTWTTPSRRRLWLVATTGGWESALVNPSACGGPSGPRCAFSTGRATRWSSGKAHGAAGIFLRGVEHGYQLCDPYFFPLYETAQDLELVVFVHLGIAAQHTDAKIGSVAPYPSSVMSHWMALMSGFYSVLDPSYSNMGKGLADRFPRLRWCFVEGGAAWVPLVLDIMARRVATEGGREMLDVQRMAPDELSQRNVFVTVGTGEDLPYLVSVLGDDILCAATDYGHNDHAANLGAHTAILEHPGLDETSARKIADLNGRRILAVDENFRPAVHDRASRDRRVPHIWGTDGSENPAVFPPLVPSGLHRARQPAEALAEEVTPQRAIIAAAGG